MRKSILHLCNTFFEWELADNIGSTLEEAFAKSPIFSQLQFLPYLYGNSEDGVVVSKKPEKQLLSTFTLDEHPHFDQLETWGHSLLAKEWADKRGIPYRIPPWDLVKMVNSKTYSFAKSPMPGARLIFEGDQIETRRVLKSCFGTAGRGFIFDDDPKAKEFCKEEWKRGLPVIAEPWVERKIDFSTQWIITPAKEIAFLGACLCKTTPRGVHQSNTVGNIEAPYIEDQKQFILPVLEEMAEMGFFGEVGFDGMVYEENQLQPIVEINARKTMGWLALMIQQKNYPGERIEVSYISSDQSGPLPSNLGNMKFSRQIHIQILPRPG